VVDLAYSLGSRVLDIVDAALRFLAAVQANKIKLLLKGGPGVRRFDCSVTNVCNAKCTFCVYPLVANLLGRSKGVLEMSLFRRRADEAASSGITTSDLTPVVGDPLVDPRIDEKIQYLISIGFKEVCITTNALLLERFADRLIASKLTHLFISLPSCDKEDYKAVYGVDSWPMASSGIAYFLRRNRELGEPIKVRFRFRNALKPSAILRSADFARIIEPYLSERVTLNFTPYYDNWGGAITRGHLKGIMRMRKGPKQIRVPCRGLFSFKMLHDGKVRLCGCRFRRSEHDDMIVGDANHSSLSEIAKSETVINIVAGFFRNQVPECCRECSFYSPVTLGWLRHNAAKSIPPRQADVLAVEPSTHFQNTQNRILTDHVGLRRADPASSPTLEASPVGASIGSLK